MSDAQRKDSVTLLFLNGSLGAFAGAVVGFYFPQVLWLQALSTGAGSVVLILLGRMLRRPGWLVLFILVAITSSGAAAYLTLIDRHEIGERLYVTTPVCLRSSVGKSKLVSPRALPAGTRVRLMERSWRKYRIVREHAWYLDYWKKIRLKNGTVGWVYGAYLSATPIRLKPQVLWCRK